MAKRKPTKIDQRQENIDDAIYLNDIYGVGDGFDGQFTKVYGKPFVWSKRKKAARKRR